MRWQCVAWNELARDTLYAILRLRAEVFVIEQACLFNDVDGNDPHALHVWCGTDANPVIACARIVAPGVLGAHAVIGRVVVAPSARGQDLGRALMHAAIAACRARFTGPIDIGAQARLERFYAELGFVRISGDYLEDGIAHISMQLAAAC